MRLFPVFFLGLLQLLIFCDTLFNKVTLLNICEGGGGQLLMQQIMRRGKVLQLCFMPKIQKRALPKEKPSCCMFGFPELYGGRSSSISNYHNKQRTGRKL